jgi:hypothetical protein
MPSTTASILNVERRKREPAVPADHRGHTVKRRWREQRIPEDLRVHMGVHVDEPGRDDAIGRVDHADGVASDGPDVHDPTAGDGHIGPAPRGARAVDDVTVADHQVEHVRPLGSRKSE